LGCGGFGAGCRRFWGPTLFDMAGGTRAAARGLLERGGELARIEEAMGALVRGQGGVLVIQGAAGIGKSALVGSWASTPPGRKCTR
jgi:hypothetical protein